MNKQLKAIIKAIIPEKQRGKIRQGVNKVRYYGDRFECPVCGSRVKRLLGVKYDDPVLSKLKVIGGGYREVICPVCNSSDRERLVYLYLAHKTNIFNANMKILHFAPEGGLSNIFQKHTNIDYATADLFMPKVTYKIDITNINFDANTFDFILCNHVLEHVIDDRRAMGEIFRVLKPGGWAILQVPISLVLEKTLEDFSVTSPSERKRVFGQSDHVRIYALDYVERLQEKGFEVEQFKWWTENDHFSKDKNKYGLTMDETLFIVRKPQNSQDAL